MAADIETFACSSQCHIEALGRFHEANIFVRILTYAGDDDNILFLALKPVHRVHDDVFLPLEPVDNHSYSTC